MDKIKVEEELEQVVDIKEKIDLLNSYCKQFFKLDKEYAENLLSRASSLSMKADYDKGFAIATINRAVSELQKGNYEEVLIRLDEAEVLLNKVNSDDSAAFGRVYNLRGVVYSISRDYLKAAENLKKSLACCEESADLQAIGDIYNNLSLIYEEIDRVDLSIEYLKKAVDYNNQCNNSKGILINLCNLAHLLQKTERYSEALDYLDEACEIYRKGEIVERYPSLHMLYGKCYQGLGDSKKALDEYLKGLSAAEKSKDPFEQANVILQISRYYLDTEQYDILTKYLKSASTIIEQYNIELFNRELYELYWKLYERRGRYKKAFYYLQKLFQCDKKKYNLEIERNIKNIESESLKKSNKTISLISKIGREITATLDLKKLLLMIYQNINSLMDVSIFGIASYKKQAEKIFFDMFVEQGEVLPFMSTEIDSPQSLIALAIRDGKEIVLNDLDREVGDYLPGGPLMGKVISEEFKKNRPQSLIIIPFYSEGEVTGAITVQSYRKSAYSLYNVDALKALSSYVSIALTNARKAEMIKEQNKALKKMAVTDALTGIYNRREFEKKLKIIWDISSSEETKFSILMLDIDHFKEVNDNYGHLAGDYCLKVLSGIFHDNLPGDSSFLARYGGEEFIILLTAGKEEALTIAEAIRRDVAAALIEYEESSFMVTVSIGVTTVSISQKEYSCGPEKCIAQADNALYQAKEAGRDRVRFAEI